MAKWLPNEGDETMISKYVLKCPSFCLPGAEPSRSALLLLMSRILCLALQCCFIQAVRNQDTFIGGFGLRRLQTAQNALCPLDTG